MFQAKAAPGCIHHITACQTRKTTLVTFQSRYFSRLLPVHFSLWKYPQPHLCGVKSKPIKKPRPVTSHGLQWHSFKMPSRIAGPFSGAVTRQAHLEIKFCLTWTIKSEQSKITNVLCLILLRHVIFWKPCQIPLFQQNLAQNLDYQSASPIRPHKHSFSPSRVLIHFYPALFQIPPGLVLGIHIWQMIWWDSNKTWMNPYFTVRQNVWLV